LLSVVCFHLVLSTVACYNREEGYGTEGRNFYVSSVLFIQFYPLQHVTTEMKITVQREGTLLSAVCCSSSSIHYSMLQQRRRLWYREKELCCQ